MKRKILKLLVILASAIILIALIMFTNSWQDLETMFRNSKLYWLAAAFGCMVVYWVFDAFMLHTIAKSLLESQPVKDSIRVTMIGQFFNSITPFSGAGQPVQVYVMVKDGMKPGHAASIVIIKTMLHQVIIVIYSILAYILTSSLLVGRIPHFYYLFILGLIINLVFLFFYTLFLYNRDAAKRVIILIFKLLKKLKFLKKLDTLQGRIESELSSFGEGAAMLKSNTGVLIKLIVYQVIQFTFYFSIPYFIHLAVEAQRVSPLEMIAAQSMIVLISLLVPLPGGTGGIEGLSYLFYNMFFTRSYIIPVILIYRILTYYIPIVFGGMFALFAPEKPLKRET